MCVVLSTLLLIIGCSHTPGVPVDTRIYYTPPVQQKESWQRLLLLQSSTFIVVAKEGQVGHDSCLYVASRSLGISRYLVLAEGIADAELRNESKWIDRHDPGEGVRLLAKTSGRKRLQSLLLLGAYYAFEPGTYYKYRDSTEYFLNLAVSESKALKEGRLGRIALCLLAKMYVQENDPKGDSIYNVLIDQSRKASDREMEARAFAYRGIHMKPAAATLLGKVADLQKAATLYKALGNVEAEISVVTDMGYMLVVTGQLQQAHDVFLQAYTLAQSIGYPYTHYMTEAMAMTTLFQGKFSEPLRYTFQTIEVAERSRDSIGWGAFYTRLSNLYDIEGRQDEAVRFAHKSIDRYLIDRDPAVFNVLLAVLNDMGRKGRAREALDLTFDIAKRVAPPSCVTDHLFYYSALFNCYMRLDSLAPLEMCLYKMDSLESIAETIRGPIRRKFITDGFAMLYYKQKQYEKSRVWFEKRFETAAPGVGELSASLVSYNWLISADSALGDHESAVAHYKRYTQLLDANFRVTKVRQAEELQVTYEIEEKEDMIASLNKEASQATLVRNLVLGAVGAVVIIAALLYRQNRLKQKSNEVITQKNSQLQHLLTDREWLLREIHHRVKNNLQIVMSLLNSQSVYINNDAALTAIQDSKRRVYAMSLIHQKLYQSDNIASIDMLEYINELVSHVQDTLGTRGRIIFEQQVEETALDVSQAIPLGLIINECIVNAIKYAFPDGKKGQVKVSLLHDDPDHLVLNITDDGIGLPVDFDMMEHNSLGLELIRGLAKQLKGRFNMINHDGLHITVRFAVVHKMFSEEVSNN